MERGEPTTFDSRYNAQDLQPSAGDKLVETRRALGRTSAGATMLSTSFQEGEAEHREPGSIRSSRGEVTRYMPIVLATSGDSAISDRVLTLLDQQRIAYDVVYISEYAEPRLQVGSAELVGEQEILAHLDELRQLAGV